MGRLLPYMRYGGPAPRAGDSNDGTARTRGPFRITAWPPGGTGRPGRGRGRGSGPGLGLVDGERVAAGALEDREPPHLGDLLLREDDLPAVRGDLLDRGIH